MDFGILTNASLPVINQATYLGLVQNRKELDLVKPHLDRLRLRFRRYDQPVSTLSGGNQQKVVLSKWLAMKPRIILFDEPTQGVDVQTKAEVHTMIADLARHGIAIILISSELPELVSMCHRILVLKEGRVTGEFDRSEASQEQIMHAATGVAGGERVSKNSGKRSLRPSQGWRYSAVQERESPKISLPPLFRKVFARRELGLLIAMAAVVYQFRNQSTDAQRLESHRSVDGRCVPQHCRCRADARPHHSKHRSLGSLCHRSRCLSVRRYIASSSRPEHICCGWAGVRGRDWGVGS